MAKLYIPKDCVLEGALTQISYSGDIVIESELNTKSVTSTGGGVVLHSDADTLTCDAVTAATGLSVRGRSVVISAITGEEGEIEAQDLQCHALTLSDHLALKAETLRVETLKAKSGVIEADRIEIDSLEIEGDLILRGREVNVVECRAGKLQLSGQYQGERMTAVGGVHQEQGSITVRFLDTRTYSAEDHVRGMVAISTAEEVRAVGVRGFLRPDEFDILSGNNNTSMDLSVPKPIAMAPPGAAAEPSASEPETFAEPSMPEGGDEGWLVEAEPPPKDPDILHSPNDPDLVDTRSVPTGELELVTAGIDDAFVPTHEFVPPEPVAVEPPAEEEPEPEPEVIVADDVPTAAAFSTNPTPEGGEDAEFEPRPDVDESEWKPVEELPDSMEAAASAAEEMMEVANASVDGQEEGLAVETPVEELGHEDLASFDTGFDDPSLPSEFEVVEEVPAPGEEPPAFEEVEPTPAFEEVEAPAFEAVEAAPAFESDVAHDDVAPAAVEAIGDISADDLSGEEDLTADSFGGDSDTTEADVSADDVAVAESEPAEPRHEVSADDLVREAVSDIRADDLEADISAEDLEGGTSETFGSSDDFDAESLSEMNDYMNMDGEDDGFAAAKEPNAFGDISAAGDPEDFQSVPEFGNTTDLEELGAQDVTADDLTSQPEPFTSQPEIQDGLDDSGNQPDDFVADGVNEDVLAEQLNGILDQICAFFPEKNYPKFVGQIQRYVDERRYKILAKERNKEAVLSRINKLEHPEITALAQHFYQTLAEALNR